MNKEKYYVSVQAGTLSRNQGDAPYELEIEATEDEAEKLYNLFEAQQKVDESSYIRAHIPVIPYHHDAVNDATDQNLADIYATLHQLGTEETKRHIESMNLNG